MEFGARLDHAEAIGGIREEDLHCFVGVDGVDFCGAVGVVRADAGDADVAVLADEVRQAGFDR